MVKKNHVKAKLQATGTGAPRDGLSRMQTAGGEMSRKSGK